MKKIVLSTLVALSIASVASAGDVKLYSDDKGQVFTMPAEGRTEIKTTPVTSKASKLDFSGLHYLGYTYKATEDLKASDVTATGLTVPSSDASGVNTGKFEMRRNYVQVKGYFFEDPKSYARVTLDFTNVSGYNTVIVKYAYLFLNNVLPFTGVEFGQAHRPWIDYEEHNGWFYRSISKTMTEAAETADLSNSADLGVNFKTKTDYFTSEIGLFNGEGYHGDSTSNTGTGNSLEWRLTAALMGDGKAHRHATKDTWFDASFWGQLNAKNGSNTDANSDTQTYKIYGLHTVYNMPSFLLSAQYIKAENDIKTSYNKSGSGYSVNGTVRLGEKKEYEILARYDHWTATADNKDDLNRDNYIYGLAWEQNKNLKWLLTGQTSKNAQHANYKGTVTQDYNAAMLTAQVEW
ncbi:OprO/OprP family phosphate-selective porin [bacterium]|nr:OprO/OprP family phosphate-selective porin [bacterium]MBU1883646.1 OprO/OprP family phosphate-selective porin [bacterium]